MVRAHTVYSMVMDSSACSNWTRQERKVRFLAFFFLRHGKMKQSYFYSIGSISVIKYLNISDKKPKSPLSESNFSADRDNS